MADRASEHDTPVETKDEAAPVSDDRRRLLKLGAYVPPAILGMAILGREADASEGDSYKGHNIGSCLPSACSPCLDSGNKNKGKCKAEQTKKSNKS